MANISRSDINAALRELLGLRGSFGIALDETVQPVLLTGDLAGVGPLSYAAPFVDFGDGAGNAAGHGAVLLRNPAGSGVLVTVEWMNGRASGGSARVDSYVGTVARDFPEPAFDLATAETTVIYSRIHESKLPAVEGTPLIIKSGAKTGPSFGGRQWGHFMSNDIQVDVLKPPCYWVLPPDSWIGARNHLAGATAALRLQLGGRIWPLG